MSDFCELEIDPAKLWLYYLVHKKELEDSQHLVAKDDEREIEVYVTDEDNKLCINIFHAGEFSGTRICTSRSDTDKTVAEVLKSYLSSPVIELSDYDIPGEEHPESKDEERREIEDEMYERSDEIFMAFKDFVEVLLKPDTGTTFDVLADADSQFDMMENVLDFLSDEGIQVYCPMFLIEDDAATETYVEYPYGTDKKS